MSRKLYKTSSFIYGALLSVACAGPCLADESAAPGPGLEARQKLLERIQQARSQGMGIGGYMQAYKALEEQVKAGDSEDKIHSRVENIKKALNDQMERARILKTQKPLPPQGSQVTGSGSPAEAAAAAAAAAKSGPGAAPPPSGGGGGDMMSKLKGKFGDKLDNLPDSIKEKLLSNPDAQAKIMEKIKERTGGGVDAGPPPGAAHGGPGGPGGQPPPRGGNANQD